MISQIDPPYFAEWRAYCQQENALTGFQPDDLLDALVVKVQGGVHKLKWFDVIQYNGWDRRAPLPEHLKAIVDRERRVPETQQGGTLSPFFSIVPTLSPSKQARILSYLIQPWSRDFLMELH